MHFPPLHWLQDDSQCDAYTKSSPNPNFVPKKQAQSKVFMCNFQNLLTFQHADMHGIIGFLRDTEHDLQTILEFSFSFFTAC